MHYWTFVGDFARGLFREKPRKPFSKRAVVGYFDQLGRGQYLGKHAGVKDTLYLRRIAQSQIIQEALRKPGLVVVDLGAGNGDLENLLHLDPLARVIMLDLSCQMLVGSKGSKSRNGHLQIVGDLENVPLEGQCADVAFMINVTPYLPDLRCVIGEVRRVLKIDGLFVLMEPIVNPVWEEEFDGVRICLRNEGVFMHETHDSSFELLRREPIRFDFLPPLGIVTTTFAMFWLFRRCAS